MKENKALQMVHEAELTRQHARYKIPAYIEIDGRRYRLYDWSLSGCAIIDLDPSYVSKFTTAKLVFPFDDFVTIVNDVKVEFLNAREIDGNKVVGARFSELTPQQISILNTIIRSFIEGDIVTQDDIIHVVSKTQMHPKKIKPKVSRTKAYALLALIYTTLALLLFFLGYVIYQRTFIVWSENGYIDVQASILRSPAPAYIKLQKGCNETVHKGDLLGVANFTTGQRQNLIARVEGKIFKCFLEDGAFFNVAEPIVAIAPQGSTPYIVAHFHHDKMRKIKVGDRARVWLEDGRELGAKIVSIEAAYDPIIKRARPLENVYNQPRSYDRVILVPDSRLDLGSVGKSVVVKIDTWQE